MLRRAGTYNVQGTSATEDEIRPSTPLPIKQQKSISRWIQILLGCIFFDAVLHIVFYIAVVVIDWPNVLGIVSAEGKIDGLRLDIENATAAMHKLFRLVSGGI